MLNFFILSYVEATSIIKKSIIPPRPRRKSLQYQLFTMSLHPLTKKHGWHKLPNSGQWTFTDNIKISQLSWVCWHLYLLSSNQRPLLSSFSTKLFCLDQSEASNLCVERKKARENSNCLNKNKGLLCSYSSFLTCKTQSTESIIMKDPSNHLLLPLS